MDFRVLVEDCSTRRSRSQETSAETAHLAVAGAQVTLCAEPVSRFVPNVGRSPTDSDVAWCWVCWTTAAT